MRWEHAGLKNIELDRNGNRKIKCKACGCSKKEHYHGRGRCCGMDEFGKWCSCSNFKPIKPNS